jgi:hypothetical protein
MWLAALRRFLLLSVGITAGTAVCALAIGALAGTSVDRSLYLGFYWVGALALVIGIFVGSRGPVRVKSDEPGSSMFPLPFFGFGGKRMLRWATRSEQDETINNSAVFVAVGLVLLLVGFIVDTRYTLF